MALELIKINEFPQVAEPGEWIVVSGSDGVAYKISKEDFKEWLGTVTVIADKPIALADPAPTLDGVYLPTEPGTYTNAGGLEYDPEGDDAGKYVQFIKDDTVWTKLAVDLPQASNKIEEWSAGTYAQGDQVIHNGQIWSADVASTDEEPGTGADWKEVIEASNIIVENGQKPASTGAVYDVKSLVVKEVAGEDITEVIVTGGDAYGASVGAYGWGFPTLPFDNITGVSIRLYVPGTSPSSTQQRVIIRENDRSGKVVIDELFSNEIVSGASSVTVDFVFSEEGRNPELNRLWIEIYSDSYIALLRVTPTVIFTEEAGYPSMRYTTSNTMGETQVSGGLGYFDFNHSVTYVEKTEELSDFLSEAIDNTVSSNADVQKSIEAASIVDSLFSTSGLQRTGEFELFDASSGVGPQGSVINKIGFPIGTRQPFKEFTYRLRFNSGNVIPTTATIEVREESYTGNVIGTATIESLSIPDVTGSTIVKFDFDQLVRSNKRLYVLISTDGQGGAYRRFPGETVVFTQANGYLPYAYMNYGSTELVISTGYYDFWFKTDIWEEEISLTEQGKELLVSQDNITSTVLTNENERISFTGSSVTWGDGYLQSRYVGEYIKWKQSEVASAVLANNFSNGTLLANRKYFLGQAIRLDGVGQELEFEITGNEVSIIQSMQRSNTNASEIDVFIDDVLYDTINNYNGSDIGSDVKAFTGDGTAVMFDLNRPFTYGHTVTLNGSPQTVTHNINQGTGFSIPSGSDCGIIRRLGIDVNGNVAVTHWLWFKTAPTNGANISISFDYGATLCYEKTTIGEDASGNNECPYGDGDTSFDPTAPSAISTGLDFRQTDERVVKTYRFLDSKTRNVRLRIKGNYGTATGTPYFIFNFATNRYFHFQNAGIGGWDLWDLDRTLSQDYLRGWQRVIEFNPDKLVIETTPNDDWIVKGHKVYSDSTLSLTDLRAVKNLPLRAITYNSGADDYTMSRWVGTVTGITIDSVTFSGTVDTPIIEGDIVKIGQYWANNYDFIERVVSSIDGNTLYFDKPISKEEVIYDSLDDFIGKEIVVRDYSSFKNKLIGIIDKIRNNTDCPIYLLENPMPNVLGRELWGYPIVMDQVSNEKPNVHSIDYMSLRRWQESQLKSSESLSVSSAISDTHLNKRVIEFGSNGQNTLAVDVLLDGVSIYGTRAVVQTGWAYTVNQSATGATLNKTSTSPTNYQQVFNGRKPRVVILDDSLTSGTIEVRWASVPWSGDSCHLNENGSKLYADFLSDL